ncbi:MAG: MaoC family dehydratase [Rhodococcus sp. (in: high G+C Gram-positive bacteria)]|uniref:MaoC family dehydratase n=1 Tax=Rhodococcus sp. TaxID=1831 RepID=UPI003BAEE38C
MLVIENTAELACRAGEHLGNSPWIEVTQDVINEFGRSTHDLNWVHCDPERAASSPFGATIAHGYYSLALIGGLIQETIDTSFCSLGLNYGLDKVRFPAAVPVGSKVRLNLTLTGTDTIEGGINARYRCVIEIDGSEKPACVAEAIIRYYD